MADIKKIKFFSIADYEEEQTWLQEMHKKGFKLLSANGISYKFEKTNPEDYIYQLEYKNEEVTEEYIQMFKDYGWEYIGINLGWNYFRKRKSDIHSENESQIFSEPESKIQMIENIYNTRMAPLLLIFIALIIPNLSNIKLIGKTPLTTFVGILFLLAFLLYMYIFIYCGLKLYNKKKQLG